MLPIAVQLDNYRRRYGFMLTSRTITEPWVRVRYWADLAREAMDQVDGLGPDPSYERDCAADERDRCLDMWRSELGKIKANVALAAAMRRQDQRAA